MNETNEEFFGRRRGERNAEAKDVLEAEQQRQRRWQQQLDRLIARFDPEVGRLLTAFAEDAPEIDSYHIIGPEKTGHQINWRVDYHRGEGEPIRSILVVLRYLRGEDDSGQFTPDCFSVEGLTGITTIRPPTIEALRDALGNAGFRT